MPAVSTAAVPVRAESAQVIELRSKLSKANDIIAKGKEKLGEVVANTRARVGELARNQSMTIMIGAGAAVVGYLGGLWLHDWMKERFGPDSWAGLLGVAAVGVAVIVVTPKLVGKLNTQNPKFMSQKAQLQAAGYGLGVGLLGAGAWRAYQDYRDQGI